MIGPWPWWMLAEVLAGVAIVAFILGGAVMYRLGRRDGLEEKSWERDMPPAEIEDLPPPLAPLNPDDPVDRLILEARMYEP